jgi:glutathione peroxidase-family protein
MKHLLVTCLFLTGSIGAAWGQQAPACPALLNHSFPRLQDEKPQSLCQYSGKVLLIVNTASYCGFTPQYKGLEELHARYKDRGLVVLGFPSNDFAQEKGSNKDIADFCENTFGVKFPMFAKTAVRGNDANSYHPLVECSGRGTCDRASGACACTTGYTGDACQRTLCPADCSGHGTCQSLSFFYDEGRGGNSDVYGGVEGAQQYGCKCDNGFRGVSGASRAGRPRGGCRLSRL